MTILPKVKIKALVSFPATVLDGTGIDVVRENGSYQFDLDFSDFAPPVAGVADPAHANALLWNDVTGQYSLVPLSIFGGGGGVPEANNDGQIYGRQNLGWTPITGSAGEPGEKWFTGAINPTTVIGAIDGDWYLNSVSGDYFDLVTGIWTLRGNLKGPAGPTGASGSGAGDVVGPGSSVDNNIAVFSLATGKLIKDGASKISDLATASHTHTSTNVTDFAEAVDDRVSSLLIAGTNVTLTYNDAAGTLTVAAASGVPEAPTGNLVYGRTNNAGIGAWQRAVALAGDTMTGGLAVGMPAASPSGYAISGSSSGSPLAQGAVIGHNGTQFAILAPPGVALKTSGAVNLEGGAVTIGTGPSNQNININGDIVGTGAITVPGLPLFLNAWNTTSGSTAIMNVLSTGRICKITSMRNAKTDIAPLTDAAGDNILMLKPVSYRFKNTELEPNPREHYGFIAEELAETDGHYSVWGIEPLRDEDFVIITDEDGNATQGEEPVPNAIDSNAIIAGLVNLVQRLEKRIAVLEAL